MKNRKTGKSKTVIVIGTVAFMLLFFIAALVTWTLGYWHDITFDEIVFYLSSPLEGTAGNVISAFILKVAVPTVLAAVMFAVVSVILRKKGREKVRRITAVVLLTAVAVVSCVQLFRADKRYGILKYIKSQNSTSDFADNYYVAPSKDNVKFTGKKRNLIYIYLESMETTFSDKAHGGDFDREVIPELRRLALEEGECFEGNREKLNGGHVISGATYTMGGIVAQTAGIPIAGGKTNAATTYADTFYPGIRSLGDILKDEGYNQAFMCGSPVTFGSREVYLRSHGCDDFLDYDFAASNGLIPKGYKVWWGFEDKRLFEFAKTKVKDMASSDKPFALTILTADTHFEDGYVCDLCGKEFNTQYSNVIACSSKQVSEFVMWLKQQDFYGDTTIILSGDHITMDADYCNGVDPSYERRTYTNIINPAVKPVNDRHREYTTFDLFPTTLAAMGATINGNRLGLGTNLFSDSPTLYERFGRETLEAELTKDSRFFKEITKFDPLYKSILENLGYLEMSCKLNESGKFEVAFWGIDRGGIMIDKVRGELFDVSGKSLGTCDFAIDSEKNWKGIFDAGLSFRDCFSAVLKLTATDSKGVEHVFFENTDSKSCLRYEDIPSYLNAVSKLEDVSILVATKGKATKGLSQKIRDSFSLIDLDQSLPEAGTDSFCAVKGSGIREVKTGSGMTILKGRLGESKEFEIASSDGIASVVIDSREYALDSAGYNFVVFDERTGKVIDRASFDISHDGDLREITGDTVSTGIRYDSGKKIMDLWITPVTPEVLAGKELHVYMFIWDRNDPKKIARKALSCGKYMTYRDGSTVPYFFIKDLDISGYDPASFGMMFYFLDNQEGKAVWKTKMMTDLTRDEYKNPRIPSSITFREE